MGYYSDLEMFAKLMQKTHGLQTLQLADSLAALAGENKGLIVLVQEIAALAEGETPETIADWLKTGRAVVQMRDGPPPEPRVVCMPVMPQKQARKTKGAEHALLR